MHSAKTLTSTKHPAKASTTDIVEKAIMDL
jgi:hypothetical protein